MITSSVAELSRSLLARRLSSIELTGSLLDRIETANRTLNAFLTVDREQGDDKLTDIVNGVKFLRRFALPAM